MNVERGSIVFRSSYLQSHLRSKCSSINKNDSLILQLPKQKSTAALCCRAKGRESPWQQIWKEKRRKCFDFSIIQLLFCVCREMRNAMNEFELVFPKEEWQKRFRETVEPQHHFPPFGKAEKTFISDVMWQFSVSSREQTLFSADDFV